MQVEKTTTTTRIDATASQPRPPPPPSTEAGSSSRPPLQMIKPRNEKRQQQQHVVASSSFRKVVFISFLALVAFIQLFRVNIGGDGGFAAKSISKQQKQGSSHTQQRQGSVVVAGSIMTENNNNSTHTRVVVPSRITSSSSFKQHLEPNMSNDNASTITSPLSHENAFTISSFLSRNNVTNKALQQKINHWLASGAKESLLPKPPNTPGAFIHVGKTGGSTLCSQLRNGCHSWVKKPCRKLPITNESRISLLSTYYHTPDFHLLTKQQRHYDFYVWTLRDPFSRLLSAFTYQHPRNMGHAKDDKYWAKYVRQSMPAFTCFPTLESFASAIGDEPDDFDYPFDVKVVNNTDCTRLARAMMQNKVLLEPSHFYHDMKHISTYMPAAANATILAIRTEYMWDDWITANQWLGQLDGVATFPAIWKRQQNGTKLPVTKDISPLGQKRLCRALKAEYKDYFDLVERAVNLGDKERQETYDLARRNCPDSCCTD